MNATKHLVFAPLCALLLGTACGKKAEPPASPPPAAPAVTDAPTLDPAAPTAPLVVTAEVNKTPPAVPSVAPPEGGGLNGLEIRFFEAFKQWIDAAAQDGTRLKALESSGVSNAAMAAIDEERGADDACRRSWVWLEVMDSDDGKGLGEVTAERFGGDCCGADDCERTPSGHHLHFLRSLLHKDWAAVAAHLPPEGALTMVISTDAGEERTTTGRAAIAEGTLNIPGCGPLMSRPSCDESADEEGRFACRCDAGGYHVTYAYQLTESRRGLASLTLITSDEH